MKITNTFVMQAALFLASVALVPSCSNNGNDSKDSKDVAEDVNEQKFDRDGEKDADRMNDAYVASLYEVKASENAATRATTAEVKKLAEMMVKEHTQMNNDIQALAGRKNITLATDITDDLNDKFKKLTEKDGLDYDKEYLEQMRERHQEGIKLMERTRDKAEDAEIKDWAISSEPKLRAHLDMIESAHNTIKDIKDNDHKDHMKDKNTMSNSHTDMNDGRDNTTSGHAH